MFSFAYIDVILGIFENAKHKLYQNGDKMKLCGNFRKCSINVDDSTSNYESVKGNSEFCCFYREFHRNHMSP